MSYYKNLLPLLFCLFCFSLSAQISSNLAHNILRIEEDDTHFSTLDKERLLLSAGFQSAELNAADNFLKLSTNPILNTTKTSKLTSGKLLIQENVFFAPYPPNNYSYFAEIYKSAIEFHYKNIDTNTDDNWRFSTSSSNSILSFDKSVAHDDGEVTNVTFTSGLSLKYDEIGAGTPIKVGIYGIPEYTLDITHQTSTGGIWDGGNGLSIRNNGSNHRDWLHYVVNSNGNYSFYADGNLKGSIEYATGNWVTPSDKKLKKNIRSLDSNLLQKINQLRPTIYQFKKQESKRKVYGLIAQEVQKIFPDIVIPLTEDGKTIGVSYTELIPILIAGIQEQQKSIKEGEEQVEELETEMQLLQKEMETEIQLLQKEMEELKKLVLGANGENNNSLTATISSAKLFQNAPNPFNRTTTIKYFLPERTTNAVIKITNVSGQLLKVIPISETGEGNLLVNTNQLVAGTYQYSLWIGIQLIETRQMVLATK